MRTTCRRIRLAGGFRLWITAATRHRASWRSVLLRTAQTAQSIVVRLILARRTLATEWHQTVLRLLIRSNFRAGRRSRRALSWGLEKEGTVFRRHMARNERLLLTSALVCRLRSNLTSRMVLRTWQAFHLTHPVVERAQRTPMTRVRRPNMVCSARALD